MSAEKQISSVQELLRCLEEYEQSRRQDIIKLESEGKRGDAP